MKKDLTLYEILEIVDETISQKEIKAAYKKLIRLYHPDLNQDRLKWAEEVMKQVNHAYAVLSDVEKRRAYQAELSEKRVRLRRLKREQELRKIRYQQQLERKRKRDKMIKTGLEVAAGGALIFAFVALINEAMKS